MIISNGFMPLITSGKITIAISHTITHGNGFFSLSRLQGDGIWMIVVLFCIFQYQFSLVSGLIS
jgi:hypothetical protein